LGLVGREHQADAVVERLHARLAALREKPQTKTGMLLSRTMPVSQSLDAPQGRPFRGPKYSGKKRHQ